MIKVIAVDDEPAFTEILGIYLKEYGDFNVITYTSPDQALANLGNEQVDAIISDYMMAEMDGITFFGLVKAKIPGIPFLLLTGRDDTSVFIKAMDAGIDFIQLKSETPTLLFADIAQKIRSAVEKYRAQKEIGNGIRQREIFVSTQRDLMNRLSASSTLNQASDACLTSVRYLAGCTTGGIHLFNKKTGKMDLLISHNLPDEYLKRFTYGDLYKVFYSGVSQYFILSDINGDELVTGGQIPILGGAQTVGVLSFICDSPRTILPETRDTMDILVSLLGNSIARIQSEEQVRIRQDELNELYVAMEELVIVIDMDGTILSVNPAVSRTLGYQEQELIGEPIHILYPDEIRDTIIFQFLDLTGTGDRIQNTYPFITRAGIRVPVETRGTIGVWGGRNVLFCISREISERLIAERSLHEYYERVQAILTSSTAQIYMKDANLRYLATNRPFVDFVGYGAGSLEGLTDADIFPESISLLRKQVDMQVIAGDVPVYNIEEEMKDEEGNPIWLVTSKVPVHDQEGIVTGIVGTSLDITDLVRTRQEILIRDKILSAVSSVAYNLVRTQDWESFIPECLHYLGEATGKDRVFFGRIIMNEMDPTCSITYEWWQDPDLPQMNGVHDDIPRELVISSLKELIQSPSLQGNGTILTESLKRRYADHLPSSYLLIPICTSESIWGVLGFFDYHSASFMNTAETDSLVTASGIIGSVIERSQTEELFHKPVERSLVGIYLVQDEHFVYVNPRMSEILGYSRDTLEMMVLTQIFHPDDISLASENHHRVIDIPLATDDYEVRAITADGRVIFLENLISQFRYQGRPAVMGSIMDITARKVSESGLRQSLREKEILLREVHHRVKNNMQIIVSLLRMQSSMIDNPDIVGILQESKNRILSMAMIHEKLYRTDNLMSVNLLEYLNALAETMIADFSPDESLITLDLICDPTIEMTIDAGIPLGLIINELLTNTFKHGLARNESGIISIIVIHKEPEWLDITYKDSGKGLPEGFKLEECDSLGMQLITNLVFQASGEMTMGSHNGIVVTLKIPMKEGFIISEVKNAARE
jgi:PAS domain S-box-containing protein